MNAQDRDVLARTLYGEARGEYARSGIAAFIAIGNVVMNRVQRGGWYGRTVAEVCLKPQQFSCWNEGDPNRFLLDKADLGTNSLFRLITTVVENLDSQRWPDLTGGCDHYHAASCHPSWAKGRNVQVHLGNHLFYQLEKRFS